MRDKDKKEYIILILTIILLTAIWIYTKSNSNRMNYILPKIPSIKKQNIDKIIIVNKNNKFILNKKNKIWFIQKQNYLADSEKIVNMLNDIHNLELTTLVSKNKDYVRYWLDREDGIMVSMYSGNKKIIDIVIGKLGPNYTSTYIRLDGKPDIYLAHGNLRLSFDVDLDELRDKKILSFNKDAVNKIVIKYNGKSLIFDKKKQKDDKWNNKIDLLLHQLSSMECITYNINMDKKEMISKESFININLTGKKTHDLFIFRLKGGKGAFIGRSTDRKGLFKLSSYSVNNIIQVIKGL